MSKEFLGDRRKALEDSFFAKENERLKQELIAKKETAGARELLARASGLEGDEVLDKLVDLGIEADTWAAVSIAPLVEVAWADGKVEEAERTAVLSAAEANGIPSSSPSYLLLEGWLTHRPDGRLLEVWGEFIVSLCAELDDNARTALKSQILGRARKVAEAAGGFLGFGSKVSSEEEVVLSELGKAFDA